MPQINKQDCIQLVNKILKDRIQEVENQVFAIKEARNSETKSTAGDKYETGRAMAQKELENNEIQLAKTQQLLAQFGQIDVESTSEIIKLGSLISTSKATYWLAIPLGKMEVWNEKQQQLYPIFVISPLSPIGKLLLGKKAGDSVQFQRNSFTIEAVY